MKPAVDFFMSELERIRESSGPNSNYPEESPQHPHDRHTTSSEKSAVSFFHKGKVIKAKSKNQEAYLQAIHQYDIVIGIGPAGTGKTYLAMAMAIDALKRKKVSRIILTRPAVEAGESLGFLPGDLYAKINPYLLYG